MQSMRSVKNGESTKANDSYVEMLREQIGKDFTDKKMAGKKGRNEMGKDDFMKLMSAQLKYQDPINPLKNEEMAAQLAQFSALEQMMNVNTNLEKMAASQKPTEQVLAASLIGKKVVSDSSVFTYDKKTEPELKFDLQGDAEEANIAVVSKQGEIVREYKMAGLKQGAQSIKWDGKNDKGQEQLQGEYSFRVTAMSKNKPVEARTATAGTVTGVVFEGGKPLLIVGDKKLPIDVVGRIEDASSAPAAAAQGSPVPGTLDPDANLLTKKGDDKQNSSNKNVNVSSAPGSQKNSKNDVAQENSLKEDDDAETMKNMQGASAAKSAGIKQSGAENAAGDEGAIADSRNPYPLWNPANNL